MPSVAGGETHKSDSTTYQALLENAMRVVDKSVPDRWDRVAEMIPARSRKEVLPAPHTPVFTR
ncbi:hypothetical protein T484DRAFT_1829514 [Baffinella frigidus]|nr:hypothetical protein T484DRAFT_1829514 [Cryptophyta sp. CCMP2293]